MVGSPVRGGAVWQLVGLITRRSQVQILPPLPIHTKIHYLSAAYQRRDLKLLYPAFAVRRERKSSLIGSIPVEGLGHLVLFTPRLISREGARISRIIAARSRF